jgi:hypothetical protein
MSSFNEDIKYNTLNWAKPISFDGFFLPYIAIFPGRIDI